MAWYKDRRRHRLAAKGIKTGRKVYFKRKTDVPYYDQNLSSPDYLLREKGKKIYIAHMKPKKYLKETAGMQDPVEEPSVDEYEDRAKSGERMPIPFIDYSAGEQEGRSRAAVAARFKVKKIPVVVVKDIPPKEYIKTIKKKYPEELKS